MSWRNIFNPSIARSCTSNQQQYSDAMMPQCYPFRAVQALPTIFSLPSLPGHRFLPFGLQSLRIPKASAAHRSVDRHLPLSFFLNFHSVPALRGALSLVQATDWLDTGKCNRQQIISTEQTQIEMMKRLNTLNIRPSPQKSKSS